MSKKGKAGRAAAGVNGAIQEQSRRGVNAVTEAVTGAREIVAIGSAYARVAHPGHLSGRIEEARLAAAASSDAALKGLSVRFSTTASIGAPHSPADIIALDRGHVVLSAQVKVSASTPRLTRELSNPAYRGMQKIVPTEMAPKVRKAAAALHRRGARPDLDLRDTSKNVTDRLSARGAGAKSSTNPRARAAGASPKKAAAQIKLESLTKAAGAAAAVGGMVSGVAAACQGASAKDALVAGGKGAGAAVLHQATSLGIEALGVRVAGAGFRRLGVAGAIASVAIGAAGDGVKMLDGTMSGRDFAANAGKNTVRAGSAWAGAEAGAVIGSCAGPVGTVVGGLAGGFLGGCFGDRLVADPAAVVGAALDVVHGALKGVNDAVAALLA